jgi:hypothetical protein
LRSATSVSSDPGPWKNLRRASPKSPSAGRLNSAVLNAAPFRGFPFSSSGPGVKFSSSTPLLFTPLGSVPSSEVSLLLISVTGNPVVSRVIPEISHPRASHCGPIPRSARSTGSA